MKHHLKPYRRHLIILCDMSLNLLLTLQPMLLQRPLSQNQKQVALSNAVKSWMF